MTPLASRNAVCNFPTSNQFVLTTSVKSADFDPKGDTRLLVRGSLSAGKVFTVLSKAMKMVCDAWNKMLGPDGHFREAQIKHGKREVSMLDQNVEALPMLLNITHLRFDKVAASISFHNLFAVAVLADEYGAERAFQPWLTR